MKKLYFITHPEVHIDPDVPAPQWSLSDRGKARMRQMTQQPWVQEIGAIYSSNEQKAIDGAEILADALGMSFTQWEALGEINRSATGYLPFDEFMDVYAEFLGNPTMSVRGWEVLVDAQRRIVDAIQTVVADAEGVNGDIAIVAHGVVGLLYFCHIKGCPVSKEEEHPKAASGGNYFCVDVEGRTLLEEWTPIDPE